MQYWTDILKSNQYPLLSLQQIWFELVLGFPPIVQDKVKIKNKQIKHW